MSNIAMVRPRYVAFELSGREPLARRDVTQAITTAAKSTPGWAGPPPQMTRYSWPHGIVRVEHDQLAAVRKLLSGLAERLHDTKVRTLSSSGTLAALTGRLGILAERSEPRPPAPRPSPVSRPVRGRAG